MSISYELKLKILDQLSSKQEELELRVDEISPDQLLNKEVFKRREFMLGQIDEIEEIIKELKK